MFTAWVWNDEYFEPHWQSDRKLTWLDEEQNKADCISSIRCENQAAMCIATMFCCLNFTCKYVQIKWNERYLAHVNVIAKTANEIKRLVWMCSNRRLPLSLPCWWVHICFPFLYTNFSQQFKLWSQTQVIILRNFHTAFAHASKVSKANTNPPPLRRLMCVNMC